MEMPLAFDSGLWSLKGSRRERQVGWRNNSQADKKFTNGRRGRVTVTSRVWNYGVSYPSFSDVPKDTGERRDCVGGKREDGQWYFVHD